MRKIAVTGLIGSGKSFVVDILRQQNIFVMDLDKVTEAIRNTSAKDLLVNALGTTILTDGEIDKKTFGKIIFSDATKKRQVEEILHPMVLEKMLCFFEEHKQEKLVVIEMALVFELGWEKYFDEVWAVSCDQDVAIKRLMNYRNYTQDMAEKILSQQLRNEDKIKRADQVIINNSDKQAIIEQLNTILRKENLC